jgi:hypothetical protein
VTVQSDNNRRSLESSHSIEPTKIVSRLDRIVLLRDGKGSAVETRNSLLRRIALEAAYRNEHGHPLPPRDLWNILIQELLLLAQQQPHLDVEQLGHPEHDRKIARIRFTDASKRRHTLRYRRFEQLVSQLRTGKMS